MDLTRNRLRDIALIFLIKALFITALWGDWNEDYLSNSFLLIQSLDCFGESDEYKNYLVKSQNFKQDIESSALNQELSQLRPKDKKNFFEKKYVIKKRPNQNINESFFWEISIILSLNDYVTRSFPLEIGNNLVIVQPFEKLEIGSWIVNPPLLRTNKVTIRDFFYAHILAFLLGSQDLSGMNIGLTTDNNIRFFDNEDVFCFGLMPYKTSVSFFVPFISVAFDWLQYREPLSEILAYELKEFISLLKERKNKLSIYANIRGVPENIITEICNRIDLLHGCEFHNGMSFENFIQFLYPRLSEGLDELNEIVSEILHRKIDHGIALFFATRMIRYFSLTEYQKKNLDSWIEHYVQ